MKKIYNKKTLIIISLMLLASLIAGVILAFIEVKRGTKIVLAGSGHNIIGFAWSSAFGWISFNSSDCDVNNNGYIDIGNCGGDDAAMPTYDYGVAIDSNTGDFSGYAWSQGLGWIDFAPAGGFPGTPGYSTRYDSQTGKASGWAKIPSLGDEGWLKMSDDSIVDWNGNGVGIDPISGDFSGWAWNASSDYKICAGGDNDGDNCVADDDCPAGQCDFTIGSGWISFNSSDCDYDGNGKIDSGDCGGDNATTITFDYGVNVNIVPATPAFKNAEEIAGECKMAKASWEDKSGDESGFTVEYKESGGDWSRFCPPPQYEYTDPNVVSCSDYLEPSKNYYFRVKAVGSGGDSPWSPDDSGMYFSTTYCAPVLSVPGFSCDSTMLAWTQNGTGVDHYEVWRSVDGGEYALVSDDISPDIYAYDDPDIDSGKIYEYYVKAQGNGFDSNIIGAGDGGIPCPDLPTWKETKTRR